MKIYDYYEDNSLSTVIFVLITIICFAVLIFLIIHNVKGVRKHGFCLETALLLAALIVTAVFTCFLSCNSLALIKFDVTCGAGNYETVSGPVEIVAVTRNDYRDSEQYDIDFFVNEMRFQNTTSFSTKQKELILSNLEKDIEVRYSFVGKELVIYQILICINE